MADYAALGGMDSEDSLLGANQIQGFFWEAVLGVMERLVLSDAAWERMAPLIIGRPVVMADTAYDADHLHQAITAKGALAVISKNPSRALKYPLDKHLYAQRHLVECCFSKLKQFRRVAIRFEKTARNYRAVVTLAAIILWMR
jgi:transposase